MLFNSYLFLFAFLPITYFVFRFFSYKNNKKAALLSLVIFSMLFYIHWNPPYIILLLLSVISNFFLGKYIEKSINYRKFIFCIGIFANLLLLFYFKYANFFIDNVNAVLNNHIFNNLNNIIFPLGISFWTFQQISYLIDIYKRTHHAEQKVLYYIAYIFFFPHLIAGPIVRHEVLISQLKKDRIYRLSYKNIVIGLCFLSVGLFKKVVIADQLAPWVNDVFDTEKESFTFAQAWLGALSYTLQIYFDFSGYSDMAIGIAKLFNIDLPINFYSPYKSYSIIEFWRRWHITLSSFLRDYLYIPLGGKFHKYRNLCLTMLIGGLWHGAGWTFVMWGGTHGFLLSINHWFRQSKSKLGFIIPDNIAWLMTFLAVTFCWVFFRAHDMTQASNIILSMLNFSNIESILQQKRYLSICLFLVILCRFLPETFEFIKLNKNKRSQIKIYVCILMMLISIIMMNTIPTEFLYFQF